MFEPEIRDYQRRIALLRQAIAQLQRGLWWKRNETAKQTIARCKAKISELREALQELRIGQLKQLCF